MIKSVTFFFLILSSFLCYSQEEKSQNESKTDFAISPGLILQGNLFADVNILIGKVTVDFKSKVPIVGIRGFRLGFESNFLDNENYTLAPKIGYEISPMFFTIRLSAVNYFQNSNSEFRVLPELGFGLGGWVNLTYGYGIPLKDQNLRNVSKHRVALTFNLNKKLRKGSFKLLK